MGWLFGNKRLADLSELHTDIHSHLIPGIDDGAVNIKESLDLIRGMAELGYKKLVITPHVRSGSFENDTRQFDSRLEELQSFLQKKGVDIKLEVGAEHTIDDSFFRCLRRGTLKSFGKSKYLLIEFPFTAMPLDIKDLVFDLQSAGYNLILAHPERYLYLRDEPDTVEYLHDSGLLFQINILSLVGFYNRATQKFAQKLIKNDLVDLVGSDLHHQKHLNGLKKALSNKYLIDLVESGRLMNSMF